MTAIHQAAIIDYTTGRPSWTTDDPSGSRCAIPLPIAPTDNSSLGVCDSPLLAESPIVFETESGVWEIDFAVKAVRFLMTRPARFFDVSVYDEQMDLPIDGRVFAREWRLLSRLPTPGLEFDLFLAPRNFSADAFQRLSLKRLGQRFVSIIANQQGIPDADYFGSFCEYFDSNGPEGVIARSAVRVLEPYLRQNYVYFSRPPLKQFVWSQARLTRYVLKMKSAPSASARTGTATRMN